MAELLGNDGAGGALLLRAVEAKENENGLAGWSGGRVGGSSRGLQRQDGRGVWLRGQAAGDECPPRGHRFLKFVRHCSSPFSYPISLTPRIDSV